MSDLKELEVIETALVGFESSSHGFNLSPDIDKGLRVSRSGDSWIFRVGEHEIKFRTHEKVHTFLEVPGVPPPMFLSQSIPFSHGVRLGLIEHISRLNKKFGYLDGWVFSSRFSHSLARLSEIFKNLRDRKDTLQEREDRDLFRYV